MRLHMHRYIPFLKKVNERTHLSMHADIRMHM